jgi:hypothetical protein
LRILFFGRRLFERQGTLRESWSDFVSGVVGEEREGRTKISSAVRDGLLSSDMFSDADRMLEWLDRLAMAGSRNGLRETGRGGGSSKGEAGLCAEVGDTARLRKGLFDERFNDNPADRWSKWESAIESAGEEQVRPSAPCMRMTTVMGNMKQQSP